nr:ribonuclease H-like domain-containing protein [Tanacetum cinerariifolium]
MVTYLSKSDAIAVKKVNDVIRLQALVDKKKVVITEATIREALRLDDVEGVECLPNEEIFAELVRIVYEKPSTKLTFYNAFFSSQWKRIGKGFSGVETPLFEGMLVEQHVVEAGDADDNVNAGDVAEGDVTAAHGEVPTIAEEPSIPSPTPPTPTSQPSHDIPSTSQFWIQQYLQHEHYAMWEVIEFRDSYVVPANTPTTDTTSGEKSGRTITLTAEDMQRKKNDVKARTTLLLSLPDEHQLQFCKYKTTRELWASILKTFGGNEATKKTKKNLLKQQYGKFKVKGSKTLEQTFNRLQVIVDQLQFMDVDIKKDDLNQKFLTSLAPEWLMHTIVWRNRSDLDTMSLDDLYNHLKVYESEVQKKSEPNSQNMAFISSAKHSSRNEDGNTVCIPTASTNVPIASASVATISQDTACTYIAFQSSGSQIKFEDINQIDEDDIEEMDIKWNMALLSTRADNYMENDKEDHALVADEFPPTEFTLMANTSAESKVFDNSLCLKDCKKNNDSLNSKITDLNDKLFDANNFIYHYKLALAQVESRLVEYREREVKYIEKIRTLKFYNESYKESIKTLKKKLETLQQEKEGVDGKLAGLLTSSKDIDNIIESQSILEDDQNGNPSVSETVASPITPKPFIKFVKPKDIQYESKTDKKETSKKPPVKYAKQYIKPNKKPNVRGNQKNWNNLISHQLGPDFVMKKKACFNCGEFNHLASDCRKRVKQNPTPRPVTHRPYRPSQRPMRTNMNDARPNKTFFDKQAHSYTNRPVHRTSAMRTPYRAPWVPVVYRNYPPFNRKLSTGSRNFPTAKKKFPTASRKFPTSSTKSITSDMGMKDKVVNPSACLFWKPSQNLSNKGQFQNKIDDKGYWDSGCSRHMTGNISYLYDFKPFDGGYVSFSQGGCKITGKGTIKTGKLEFENVYFMKDLKYNLFSVSQICNNKNNVLFTDSECIVLGRDFKLLDDANILLRTPRQHNMYSIDLNNIVPHRDLTC